MEPWLLSNLEQMLNGFGSEQERFESCMTFVELCGFDNAQCCMHPPRTEAELPGSTWNIAHNLDHFRASLRGILKTACVRRYDHTCHKRGRKPLVDWAAVGVGGTVTVPLGDKPANKRTGIYSSAATAGYKVRVNRQPDHYAATVVGTLRDGHSSQEDTP